MLQQENGASSVLGEQRRGAKSKHERKKGSGSVDQKDSQGSKGILDRRSPVLASRKNETTAASETAAQLSVTSLHLLLNELADCDNKRPHQKSSLACQLLTEVEDSNNSDNRNNNNSKCAANNNKVNGTSDLIPNCGDIKGLSLNNNITNSSNSGTNGTSTSGGGGGDAGDTGVHNPSENQSSERSGVTGCDDFMRGMGSITGRTMGASESRSDHRSPDDDDTSFSQPAPVILTGRSDEIRNPMNSGENSRRKKKNAGVKMSLTYTSDSVPGHIGHKSVETLMCEVFTEATEEPQGNYKDQEHGKGHTKVKNNIKTKEKAPVSSACSPSSDEESTPSPPVASPERTQRPLSPQSERGGSPLGSAERCEVPWLSDPDRGEDWEKVKRRTRSKKKTTPAPLVKERHPPSHHNSHHHHHQQVQQPQQQQQQASQQLQQATLQQSSPRETSAISAATPTVPSNTSTPAGATMAPKKASPPISRIASNTDDEFPPIGPPPSHGTKTLVSDLKPVTVTTGPWGSGRMADVLQGKKVPPPPPPQQHHPPPQQPQQQQQQQQNTPTLPPPQQQPTQQQQQQQMSPPQQQPQQQHHHSQSPPQQQSQILHQQVPVPKQEGKSKPHTPSVSIANRSGSGSLKSNRMVGVLPNSTGPILPPVAGGDYGDDFREEDGLSFGNFDSETIRSIKASAQIRVASKRDEEELKSCFNYRQCVKLLNDHWLEARKTVQDPPLHPARSIVAGGIRKQ